MLEILKRNFNSRGTYFREWGENTVTLTFLSLSILTKLFKILKSFPASLVGKSFNLARFSLSTCKGSEEMSRFNDKVYV